jgi:hypothetical protein
VGRITPGLLEQLGLLGRIGEVAGEIPGGGGEFHLVVLQHTDCGITRLVGDPAVLTGYFQIQEAELKRKAVTDPRAAVAVDVALLRAIPALPGEWLISGLIYDVATGLVDIVVPPARIRPWENINTSRIAGSSRFAVSGLPYFEPRYSEGASMVLPCKIAAMNCCTGVGSAVSSLSALSSASLSHPRVITSLVILGDFPL